MYRVSALSQFNPNTLSPVILLDSAASVHVFNIKERFSNFKKGLNGQSLLWGSKIISIKEWGYISLLLKVKCRIKLQTLNNVAWILNFSFNLLSHGCLQKSGFDWSNCSDKISRYHQLIGYTPGSTARTMKLAMTKMIGSLLPPSLRIQPP